MLELSLRKSEVNTAKIFITYKLIGHSLLVQRDLSEKLLNN
jgi:hypothetical protein